jgi:hypothetical protein
MKEKIKSLAIINEEIFTFKAAYCKYFHIELREILQRKSTSTVKYFEKR